MKQHHYQARNQFMFYLWVAQTVSLGVASLPVVVDKWTESQFLGFPGVEDSSYGAVTLGDYPQVAHVENLDLPDNGPLPQVTHHVVLFPASFLQMPSCQKRGSPWSLPSIKRACHGYGLPVESEMRQCDNSMMEKAFSLLEVVMVFVARVAVTLLWVVVFFARVVATHLCH